MAHLRMRPAHRRLPSSRSTSRRCWCWAPNCLGEDRSVTELAELIAERAGGNPFFAEEIVRDLSERDVLVGGRGCYLCAEPVADVHVPRTLQAVIAARIDRLDPAAKRTLNAAAVIGSRFTPEMLEALDIDAALGDLVAAELIDQTAFNPQPEYAFRHPLIRAVAYESQLKSDRAQLHRRVAAAIEQDDQNAALIAEHLEAAGDLPAAYEWHMRAGAWSTNRDIAAAQLSWERALQVADALPADAPDRTGEAHRAAHVDMRQHVETVPPRYLAAIRGVARLVHRGRRQGVVGDGDGRHDGRACACTDVFGTPHDWRRRHGAGGVDRRSLL